MNVRSAIRTDYENKANWTLGENKPNSKPIKPKINLTLYMKKIYGNFTPLRTMKNKPNSNPISKKPK